MRSLLPATKDTICRLDSSVSKPTYTNPIKPILFVNKQIAAEAHKHFCADVDLTIAEFSCWRVSKYDVIFSIRSFPTLCKVEFRFHCFDYVDNYERDRYSYIISMFCGETNIIFKCSASASEIHTSTCCQKVLA